MVRLPGRIALVSMGSLLAGLVAWQGVASARGARGRGRAAKVARRVIYKVAPGGDDRIVMPRMPAAMRAGTTADRVTVWLNGDGGQFVPGWEDSASNTSSVVYGRANEVDVPAWQGGAARWSQVVRCVRGKYADFGVDIVESRPASGDYIQAVIGGRSSVLGFGQHVGGVAPYTGAVLPRAVVFVFATSIGEAGNGAEQVCTTAAHEIGHALGLDHSMHCPDPMTYLQGCGEKSFSDVDAECGEGDVRECASGESTQNSWRHLMRVLGPASSRPTVRTPPPVIAPPAEPPVVDDDEVDYDSDVDGYVDDDTGDVIDSDSYSDDDAPTAPIEDGLIDDLQVLSPSFGQSFAAGSTLRIAIRSSDRSGIARVELGWAMEGAETSIFACDDLPAGRPVRCAQAGDLTVFELEVGSGRRGFAVRVTDGAGNQRVSDGMLLGFQ